MLLLLVLEVAGGHNEDREDPNLDDDPENGRRRREAQNRLQI